MYFFITEIQIFETILTSWLHTQGRSKTTNDYGNERPTSSAAAGPIVYSVSTVNCLLPCSTVSQSYNTRTHTSCRFVSHALQRCCTERMHNYNQGIIKLQKILVQRNWVFFNFTQNQHCNNNNGSTKVSQAALSKASDESKFIELSEHEVQQQERSLRNTFGWTRIDILTMLIVGIFLAAFCFSLLVEAIQTLIHIDHQDTMHHPIAVIVLGLAGLVLNSICYLLIGGYTYHQGSFLHITSAGDVVLERVVTANGISKGERRLSKSRRDQTTTPTPSIEAKMTQSEPESYQTRNHTIVEVLRDISS